MNELEAARYAQLEALRKIEKKEEKNSNNRFKLRQKGTKREVKTTDLNVDIEEVRNVEKKGGRGNVRYKNGSRVGDRCRMESGSRREDKVY